MSYYHNVLTVFSDSDEEAVVGRHLPFSLHLDIGLGVYSHKRECVMKRNGNKQITIPKGRKKKSPKPHFHNPLFILAHSGKITQKPVTNHLNLRLSTFLCFASQTVMCSSQRVKKPDFLPHTVALCEQYGGLHPHCRGSCWTWRGLSRQKYVQPSGPDLLRRGFWSWLCSGLSRPDLLFHKGQDSPSVCLVLQPADHTKPALPGSRHPPDLRESLCAVFGSTTYNLIEIRFLGFGWTQTGNIFKWK